MYLEHLFVDRLKYKLDRFRKLSGSTYNFRCPICGDSSTDKKKARGYLYERNDRLFFHCHNGCNGLSFPNFLKQVDSNLYRQFQMEQLSKQKVEFTANDKELEVVTKDTTINLPTIDTLPKNHMARKYCDERKIPFGMYTKLYFAENYNTFVHDLKPDEERTFGNEPRLVIPMRNERGLLVGCSGRDLTGTAKTKYLTTKIAADDIKCYFKEPLNTSKKIYVVEGPIDSMFINNSIATLDSNLVAVTRHFDIPTDKYVFVSDNEPRNQAILSLMDKIITLNYNIVIWPSYVNEKDINDMVLSGHYSDIQALIDQNTFAGLDAKLRFTTWRKK